jgi:hypothetical protein
MEKLLFTDSGFTIQDSGSVTDTLDGGGMGVLRNGNNDKYIYHSSHNSHPYAAIALSEPRFT